MIQLGFVVMMEIVRVVDRPERLAVGAEHQHLHRQIDAERRNQQIAVDVAVLLTQSNRQLLEEVDGELVLQSNVVGVAFVADFVELLEVVVVQIVVELW